MLFQPNYFCPSCTVYKIPYVFRSSSYTCLFVNFETLWDVLPFRYRITFQSVDVCPTHYLLLFHFTSPYRPHNGLKLPPSALAHLKITIVLQWTTILCGLCSPIKQHGGMVMLAWHLFSKPRNVWHLKTLHAFGYWLLLLTYGLFLYLSCVVPTIKIWGKGKAQYFAFQFAIQKYKD